MFKILSGLFSRGGGTPDDGLRRLWESLIRLGVARGLALPDAEDLAQESVVAGMQGFDAARGDFGAYCRTIMANRANSFHRAARPQVPLPEGGRELVAPDIGPEWVLYERQCRERTDRIVAGTIASLDEEAASFFFLLAEVHEEREYGEVSEAARRAGLTPQKGWDLFRRIQRHFRERGEALPLPAPPSSSRGGPRFLPKQMEGPEPPPSDLPFPDAQLLGRPGSGFRGFSTRLDERSRRQLGRFLRR